MPAIEYDTIVDEVPEVHESAVERLASLVYRLLVAYVWWLWVILLFLAVGVVVTTIVKLA